MAIQSLGSGQNETQFAHSRINAVLLIAILFFIFVKWHFLGLTYAAAFGLSLIVFLRSPTMLRSIPVIIYFAIFMLLHSILTSIIANVDLGRENAQIIIYSVTNIFILAALFTLWRLSPYQPESFFHTIVLVLLVLAFMEVYLGFRPLFEAFKLFFNSTAAYTAEDRDISLYGRIRPMIFTTEPSSSGNFFGAIWLAYVASMKANLKNYAKASLYFLLAVYIFRSPTLIGYLAVAPGFILLARNHSLFSLSYFVSVICFSNIFFYYGWNLRNDITITQLASFFSTGSFYIRQISPIETVQTVLASSPFFGYGVEYLSTARSIAAPHLFSSIGFYTYERIASMPDRVMTTNAFWELFGVFGIIGAVAFTLLKSSLLKVFGVRNPIVLLIGVYALFSSHAGIYAAFTWTPLIFIGFALMDKPLNQAIVRNRPDRSLFASDSKKRLHHI